MESQGSYIDVLANKQLFVSAFVDSGCLCLATISPRTATQINARLIPIRPRRVEQVVGQTQPPEITQLAAFLADYDGIKEDLYAYVIPGQTEPLILGKGWLTRHDASLRPAKESVLIRSPYRRYLRTRATDPDLAEVSARAFKALHDPSDPLDASTTVFTASVNDIEEALLPKSHQDPATNCPDWLRPVLYAFDRKKAAQLPPSRPGLDTEINLLPGTTAPSMPLYSMGREELLVLRKTLYDLLDSGFIRASSSSAGAPVIFVKKPGGGLRFCVDYRGLNAVTQKDGYPLPRIEETLRELGQARWVSKVDVISAFHRLRVRPGDEDKTAFRTRLGAYEWLVTPFGLCGAPAAFQRFINHVLRPWLGISCSAYLDDVAIYSSGSRNEHRHLVRSIVKALGDAGLQLDWDKSEFEADSVRYLGFIIHPGHGISTDPEKIRAVTDWEPPKNVRGVRGFLGFANFYRQFVPGYSEIATPLTALTKKDRVFSWGPDEQKAFQQLKDALIQAPLLATYRPGKTTILETDASGYALGGVLRQLGDDGLFWPIAYFSRKLSPAEVNYPVHDKEMLAIYSCIRHWQPLLQGSPFEVWTDHRNLVYFQSKQTLAERQRRWAHELSGFDFKLIHKPGATQVQSDALSRRDQDMPQNLQDDRLQTRDFQLLQPGTKGDFVIASKAWVVDADADPDPETSWTPDPKDDSPESPFDDPDLTALWTQALQRNRRYWEARRAVLNGDRSFPLDWGLSWQISECSVDPGKRLRWRNRIWIPFFEPLRTQIVQRIHDSPLAGHPGRTLTRDLVSREYAWPGLSDFVNRLVGNCQTCGKGALWREQKRGLLKPLPIPERLWQELAMDFITELPPSGSEGFTSILGITDRLSKAQVLIPMTEITAEAVATALFRHVFSHHGLPHAIVSDRGPQFTSQFWGIICQQLGIKRRLSTAFHPETDGAQERNNQEIERYLRTFTAYLQDDWASLLPVAQLTLCNRTSASTGVSPFFLNHGYHLDLLGNASEPSDNPLGSAHSPATLGQLWLEKRRDAITFAQASLGAAQESQERHANRGRQLAEAFKVGDRVWLRLKNIRTLRPSKKLDWIALPYRVIGLVGSHAVRLDTPPGVHPVFHVSLVRRARSDPLPSQTFQDQELPAIRPTEASEDLVEGEYRVERVSRHRRLGNGWRLLVHWTGWAEPTWEPLIHLHGTRALEEYEASLNPVPWGEKGANVTTYGRTLRSPPAALLPSPGKAPPTAPSSTSTLPIAPSPTTTAPRHPLGPSPPKAATPRLVAPY